MLGTFFTVAFVLFVIWCIFTRCVLGSQMKKYTKAIGKTKNRIKLSKGVGEAVNLLSIIDKAEKERHPKDLLRINEGHEFKFYIELAQRGVNSIGMLICIAHELGCEVVLRRISEEDIEDDYNKGDVFWEYLCDEQERYFKKWEPEYKTYLKKYK